MNGTTKEILKSRAREAYHFIMPRRVAGFLLRKALPKSDPFTSEINARRAIFIHVPKAAGSSVKSELYGQPTGGHRRIAEFMAYDSKRTMAFFRFCFVRNPWDRLLSAWSYLRQGDGITARDRAFAKSYLASHREFSEFVRSLLLPHYRFAVMSYDHFRPQSYWTCLPGEQNHAMDFVGRFERMESDMAKIRGYLGLSTRRMVRVRPSEHRHYREVYDSQTEQIVRKLYARDCALFGYDF